MSRPLPRLSLALAAAVGLVAMSARPVRADEPAQALYDRVSPSLVAVQFTYAGETVQHDFIVPGIVVSDSGLVMFPINLIARMPDEHLTKFKIIVPRLDKDNDEVDGVFQGRDERGEVAFVKAGPPKAEKDATTAPTTTSTTGPTTAETKSEPAEPPAVIKWVPLSFSSEKCNVGDPIYSVGMQPKSGGYHTFLTKSVVSSVLRGPTKQIMVSNGGLGSSFAPVFNADGKAIGLVSAAESLLDDTASNNREAAQARFMADITTNKYFKIASEFSVSLTDPPTPGHPVPLVFSGMMELSGLGKNDAALFGLQNQTVVQINDILPESPAEKAGLKNKEVITKVDGASLERGDLPEEAVGILERKMILKKPGDVVTFTVVEAKGKPPRDVKVTLDPFPKRDIAASRWYNEEIGFGVREMVPLDRYGLKLKKDQKDAVLVTVLKEGGSAGNAGLRPGDMITKVNDDPITSLEVFKASYEDFRKAHEHEPVVLAIRHPNGQADLVRIEPPQ